MDKIELALTALVLEQAKEIRALDTLETDADLPALGQYIERAVKELAAWHPFVMDAVRSLPHQEFFTDDIPPQ